MIELNREIRDLYHAYAKRPLKPETALEISSDFVLDLINAFGDTLSLDNPLKEGWRQFAPFEFILALNTSLGKYKEKGHAALDEGERKATADHSALLGGMVRAALAAHPDAFPDEEHFQLPEHVAEQLLILTVYE